MFRASIQSGLAAVVLLNVLTFSQGLDGWEFSANFIFGFIVASFFFWAVGAFFSVVALILLKPIADFTRPWISLSLFIIVGFAIAALLAYLLLHMGSHGDPPAIETEHWTELVRIITSMGLIGAVCAVVSWRAIRRIPRPEHVQT
jgi:hypothetical protein